MASFLTRLLNSVVEMPGRFVEVTLHDPVSAVLIAFGALFVGAAVLAGVVLGVGAVVDLFRPFRPGRAHRPRGK